MRLGFSQPSHIEAETPPCPTKASIARRIGSGSEGQVAMILAKSGSSAGASVLAECCRPSILQFLATTTTPGPLPARGVGWVGRTRDELQIDGYCRRTSRRLQTCEPSLGCQR